MADTLTVANAMFRACFAVFRGVSRLFHYSVSRVFCKRESV